MPTILLIEDHPLIRENICEIFEMEKFKVLLATNGKEGIEIAKSKKPDLILCDINMPVLNGYQVLDNLRKDTATSHTPFFFLSAYADSFEIETWIALGANGYFIKPFEPDELLQKVSDFIKK